MDVTRCRIKECFNNSANYSGGFFRFPKDRERARLWANLCKLEHIFYNSASHRNIKICGAHFEPRMFSCNTSSRQRLINNSYPTIFRSTAETDSPNLDTALKLANYNLHPGKKALQILGRTKFGNLLISTSKENVEQVTECVMPTDMNDSGSIELAYDKPQEIKKLLALGSSNNCSPLISKEIEKCRVCLEQILQKGYCMLENNHFHPNQSVRQMLIYCIPSLKDTFADKDIICETCLKELEVCFNFIRKCFVSMGKQFVIVKPEDLQAVDINNSYEDINISQHVYPENNRDKVLNKRTADIEIIDNRNIINTQHDNRIMSDVLNTSGSISAENYHDTNIDNPHPLDVSSASGNNTSNSKLRQLLLGTYPKDMLNKSLKTDTFGLENTSDKRLNVDNEFNFINVSDDCTITRNKEIDDTIPYDIKLERSDVDDTKLSQSHSLDDSIPYDIKLERSDVDDTKLSQSHSLDDSRVETENSIFYPRMVEFQLINFTEAILSNGIDNVTGQPLDVINTNFIVIQDNFSSLGDNKQENLEKSWTDLIKQDIAATHDYAKLSSCIDFEALNDGLSMNIPSVSPSDKDILQKENKTVEHEQPEETSSNDKVRTCIYKLRRQCNLCSEKFTSMRKLLFHLRVTHNGYKFYKCKECSKGYVQLNNLKRHVCQRPRRKFRCGSCDKIFEDVKEWKHHKLTVHYNFLCDLCGKAYRTRELLLCHKRTHNDSNDFQCEFCGRKFRYDSLLKSHRKIHTRTERKFLCDLCPKRFYGANKLRVHRRTHEDKKHKCHVCHNMFANPYSLSLHIKVMHDKIKEFQCNECLRCFSRKQFLEAHMHRHTGEPLKNGRIPRPLKGDTQRTVKSSHARRFNCNFCGLVFKTKINLNKHSWFHLDGGNQFRCDMCYKKFPSKEDVDIHYAATHQNKPKRYKCTQCQEEFGRKFLLENHELAVHENSKDQNNLSDLAFQNETCMQ